MSERTEIATLGGGCFWCIETIFKRLDGVEEVVSGYAGGTIEDPSYREVCSGTTGHAEVIQVRFDPERISFEEILEVFFTVHDPTTLDRQGADVGSQYRSIILVHSPQQERVARALIGRLEEEGAWPDPVVTEIAPFESFYAAEEHHQDYYRRNPEQAYCRVVIAPKITKLTEHHADKISERNF